MKIRHLHATNVHGYLPIDVDFFPDLTFLTGLNGSGKTSALRLLMALLTPNIEEFASITFSAATVTVVDNDQAIEISAHRTSDGLSLSVSSLSEAMLLTSADLQLIVEAKRRDEPRQPVLEKVIAHSVFQTIREISTPMFLGLDRRFYAQASLTEEMSDYRRREMLARRYMPDDPTLRGHAAAGLADVNFLVLGKMQEIRAAQEQLDEDLRRKFFTRAFEYKPSDITKGSRFPSRAELERYRAHQTNIERAAEGLRLPVPELQSALTGFFERMTTVVDALEKTAKATKPKERGKRASDKPMHDPAIFERDFMEWVINKPQADRILEHLQLLDEYISARSALREPINKFLSLVNGFLDQTKKTVSVAGRGELTVSCEGDTSLRPITALSSGERQLLVMLAHLSLNTSLAGSGVFIVDEPELSLHIDWQERFVDAIRAANPSVQLILATHSPAIILDRTESCHSL
ncbi:MAG: AAA family ATPase [Rhodocyclales bacterium]|nr:AAA family ATPase [Rhodocyclales bacterium]